MKITNQRLLTPPEIQHLTEMINRVYLRSEREFWPGEYQRVNSSEVKAANEKRQLFVAWVNERIAGCVMVESKNKENAGFSVLAVDAEYRNRGIAGALVEEAEQWALDIGKHIMELTLLLPVNFTHPDKQRLDKWYKKLKYYPVRAESFARAHPQLNRILKIECDFISYQKKL